MDELTQKAADQLGLDPAVVRKAVGSCLGLLQSKMPEGFDFKDLVLNKMKGSEELVKEAEAPTPAGETAPRAEGGGGPMGLLIQIINMLFKSPIMDIFKKLISMFFGDSAVKMIDSAGDGAELAGTMNKLGLSKEQGTQIVTMLVSFMKGKLDPKTVDQIADQIPAVKSFMGSSTSDKKED